MKMVVGLFLFCIIGVLIIGSLPKVVAFDTYINNSNIFVDGKVGIGTQSPNEKLDVVGNVNVTGNVSADSLFLSNNSLYLGDVKLSSGVDGLYIDGAEVFSGSSEINTTENVTTTGTGFFGLLGDLVSRVNGLFVKDINFNGTISGSGNIITSGNVDALEIRVNNLSIDMTLPGVYNNFDHIEKVDDTHIKIYADCANIRRSNGSLSKVCWDDVDSQYVNPNGTLPWVTFTWNGTETGLDFTLLTYWPDTLAELEKYAVIGRIWENDTGSLVASGRHFMLANDPYICRTSIWSEPAFNIDVAASYSNIDTNYLALSTGELVRWPIVSLEGQHIFKFSGDTQITSIWGHLQNQTVHDVIDTTGSNENNILELSGWYDNNGVATTIPNKLFSVHLIGAYASSEVLVWFRGQHTYTSMSEAEAAIGTDSFNLASWEANSKQISKIAWVIMQEGTTDFSDTSKVEFINYNRGGGGSSGSSIITFTGLTDTPSSYIPNAILYTDSYSVISNESFVYNNGNVGIGTDTPTQKLDVVGNINITGNLSVDTVFASAYDTKSPLVLKVDGIDAIYVDDVTGRIGIGTTNPQASFDVNIEDMIMRGSINVSGILNVGNVSNKFIFNKDYDSNANKFEVMSPDGNSRVHIGVDQLWNVASMYTNEDVLELWVYGLKQLTLSNTEANFEDNNIVTSGNIQIEGNLTLQNSTALENNYIHFGKGGYLYDNGTTVVIGHL